MPRRRNFRSIIESQNKKKKHSVSSAFSFSYPRLCHVKISHESQEQNVFGAVVGVKIKQGKRLCPTGRSRSLGDESGKGQQADNLAKLWRVNLSVYGLIAQIFGAVVGVKIKQGNRLCPTGRSRSLGDDRCKGQQADNLAKLWRVNLSVYGLIAQIFGAVVGVKIKQGNRLCPIGRSRSLGDDFYRSSASCTGLSPSGSTG